jgi:hypothetical protein
MIRVHSQNGYVKSFGTPVGRLRWKIGCVGKMVIGATLK